MRFARAFGGEYMATVDDPDDGDIQPPPPGQFKEPFGVAVVRGLLVVSEEKSNRLQVLTPKGVPLQVLTLGEAGRYGEGLRGLCADEQRVWVTDTKAELVHVLKVL